MLDLRENLISLDTLDFKTLLIKFESGVMKVSRGVMTMIRRQKQARNIYKLLGSTVVSGTAVV